MPVAFSFTVALHYHITFPKRTCLFPPIAWGLGCCGFLLCQRRYAPDNLSHRNALCGPNITIAADGAGERARPPDENYNDLLLAVLRGVRCYYGIVHQLLYFRYLCLPLPEQLNTHHHPHCMQHASPDDCHQHLQCPLLFTSHRCWHLLSAHHLGSLIASSNPPVTLFCATKSVAI